MPAQAYLCKVHKRTHLPRTDAGCLEDFDAVEDAEVPLLLLPVTREDCFPNFGMFLAYITGLRCPLIGALLKQKEKAVLIKPC